MKEIQLKDAKAQFSHVVDEAVAGEPTVDDPGIPMRSKGIVDPALD